MHFKGIKNVTSLNKSKKKKKKKRIKYMQNENIIKTNIHIQHIYLTDFSI